MRNTSKLIISIKERGGNISIEWPKGAKYWSDRRVIALINKYNMSTITLDGCAYGLRAQYGPRAGLYIQHTYMIATDSHILANRLPRRCSMKHLHCNVCRNGNKLSLNTNLIDLYTDELAKRFHKCVGMQVHQNVNAITDVAVSEVNDFKKKGHGLIRVKLLDNTASMPKKQTTGSAGYDIRSNIDTIVSPGK